MKLRSLRRMLPLLLGILPLAALAQTPHGQPVLAFHMSVDAEGHPTALEPPQGLPPSIGQSVIGWAKGLRFVPASIDGVPQPSTTTLRVRFDTTDPNVVKVAGAATGPGVTIGEQPPPPENDDAGYFIVAYDTAGKVLSVEFDEEHSPMASKRFTRWARRYLEDFRFEPETVGGQAVAGQVRIPLVYCHRPTRCLATLEPMPGRDQVIPGEIIARSVLSVAAPDAGAGN